MIAIIRRTHDKSLHGLKYCIMDRQGEIIDVSRTVQAPASAILISGEAGYRFLTVLFKPW